MLTEAIFYFPFSRKVKMLTEAIFYFPFSRKVKMLTEGGFFGSFLGNRFQFRLVDFSPVFNGYHSRFKD